MMNFRIKPRQFIPSPVPFSFRRFLGINRFVLSPQEYKRVLLTGQLNLLFFSSVLAFTVMDIIWDYSYPIPFNIGALCASAVIHVVIRMGHFFLARMLLAVTANAITLFFAAVLDRSMGLYQFAICINVGILAAFGYERANIAFLLIGLSTVLFILAMFHPFPRINRTDLANPNFLDRNLIFGFLIASVASASVVYYLLRVNHQFEASLQDKEQAISQKHNELLEVNAELDRFFYSVSHDLRAPLTSLQGLLNLIETTKDPGEIKQYLSMLRGRVDNLDQFVLSITSYASNARQPVQHQPVCLRKLLSEVLENVRFLPNAQAINISLDVPSHFVFSSDPTRLQIIFGNLISNAIKYHDLHKTNPYIRIRHEFHKEIVIILIDDNGAGIRPDVLPRVFDMFYRGNDQSQGTGLGLYIVKEAVEKLKGTILIESKYGEGTSFTVSLPILDPGS